jgi:hypothetical protein
VRLNQKHPSLPNNALSHKNHAYFSKNTREIAFGTHYKTKRTTRYSFYAYLLLLNISSHRQTPQDAMIKKGGYRLYIDTVKRFFNSDLDAL